HVVRKERDREPAPDGIGQPLRLLAVHHNPLASARGREARADGRRGTALKLALDLKARPVGAGDFLARRPAERAGPHRIVDGLEQVGLALGMGAEEHQAGSGGLAIELRKVAEPSSHQVAEPHYSMWICRLAMLPCCPSRSTP